MYIPSLQGNFTVHTTIPAMVKELQGPPIMRMKIVNISIIIATLLALLLYLLVGFMGAGMFGSDIKDNILTAFAPCKWLWVDILSLVYAFVTIIAYPLVLYPIKISIVGMCKKDPYTKQGYRIQVLVAVIFIILSTALAMVLESIVAIFGLFSALTGIIFYFVIPICFAVMYPKVKRDNISMDHAQPGSATLDPIVVGVVSILAPTVSQQTVERVRTLSNKLFKSEHSNSANISFLRPKTLSISVSDDGTEKIFVRNSVSNELNPKIILNQNESLIEQSVIVEENVVNEGTGEVSKMRKCFGGLGIGLFAVICGVAVYMNGADVVSAFT
ncbi:Amino_acid transporter family protein [Hexamita inflata]|uniref:Amino acid transporter family protein n=1 Tax=Hexamita inflata TaxID=28002 RepID=A0AA86RU91_9EUKA|nr:Amino acid transporter family protein [Hexamita inflata]